MILQALTGYYRRMHEDGNVAPEGFKNVEIPFLLVLNQMGEFVGFQDTRVSTGKKLVAKSFLVPAERPRSGSKAWQTANLLWDHYGYVLGWPKSDSVEHKEMALKQRGSFLLCLQALSERYPNDPEIGAVHRFLEKGDFSRVIAHPSWPECAKVPGSNLSFMIEGQTRLVCQNENVSRYVTDAVDSITSDDEDEEDVPDIKAVCLVTGEIAPVARLHPRTPILGSKSNAKIVSFQKNMGFDSYGKQQSYNAPTSRSAAFAYTTALNHLLAKGSRLQVGDASTVFWAEKTHEIENVFADLFGEPVKGEPEQDYKSLVAMFRSPETGAKPKLDPKTRFFVLGLSPNAARIAVRFWYAGTVGEVANNLSTHFDDIELIRGPRQPQYLSLFRLLISTAALGKSENIPPNIAGDFMKAILAGTPYPKSLLGAAIRRCRAEREVTYPRAALIKAVLVREARYRNQIQQEVGMALDTSNNNTGYRLGRLFATLEKIQEEANPGINATIRDRFYGSASATPIAAFAHLMKLKNHHLSKLENRGRAVNLERLICEIMDGVNDFPVHLSLADQGRFAVGYYHQRQAFFTKKSEENSQEA